MSRGKSFPMGMWMEKEEGEGKDEEKREERRNE